MIQDCLGAGWDKGAERAAFSVGVELGSHALGLADDDAGVVDRGGFGEFGMVGDVVESSEAAYHAVGLEEAVPFEDILVSGLWGAGVADDVAGIVDIIRKALPATSVAAGVADDVAGIVDIMGTAVRAAESAEFAELAP